MTPSIGDITYYAPWGNLAIFYRDSGYAKGLVKPGRIEGNVQMLEIRGPLKARIEVAGKPQSGVAVVTNSTAWV